jgi:acyl carrier protein
MDKNAFYLEVEDLLEIPRGGIQGGRALNSLSEWDSFAVISFIALADSTYSVLVAPERIAECRTVDDLTDLIEEGQMRKAAGTKNDLRK